MFVDHLFVFVFVVVVRRVVHLLRVSPPEEAAHSFLPGPRKEEGENFLRRGGGEIFVHQIKQLFLFFFVFGGGLLSLSAFFVSGAFFVFLFCFDEGFGGGVPLPCPSASFRRHKKSSHSL